MLQRSVLSTDDVCTAVFEQWLVADLSEIGASCLPPDVVSQQKYTLTGCYGLQVRNIHTDWLLTMIWKMGVKKKLSAVLAAAATC